MLLFCSERVLRTRRKSTETKIKGPRNHWGRWICNIVISWITVECVNVKVTSWDNEIWMSHYSGYSRHANLISKSLFSVTPYPSSMVSNILLGNRFAFSTMYIALYKNCQNLFKHRLWNVAQNKVENTHQHVNWWLPLQRININAFNCCAIELFWIIRETIYLWLEQKLS